MAQTSLGQEYEGSKEDAAVLLSHFAYGPQSISFEKFKKELFECCKINTMVMIKLQIKCEMWQRQQVQQKSPAKVNKHNSQLSYEFVV